MKKKNDPKESKAILKKLRKASKKSLLSDLWEEKYLASHVFWTLKILMFV